MTSTVARSHRDQRDPPGVTDPDAVFEALGIAGCRDLLRAIGDDTLTAAELGDRLDQPMSSIYRHLDTLTAADLLSESIRVDPHGRNQQQYHRPVSEVTVSVGDDFGVWLR